ncbi:hypothetical protein Glove_344g9 [Diversispora epigaea]|uniref:Uncharacterized protein n=1 Tax=Diversispora epigaea TaxID=1348612 RepID=A0A397HGI1_9GLOM|nr:hypothetical protein Glove_344g9 [Diversispora epigaea]
MSKSRSRKFLNSNATPLTSEAIQEIIKAHIEQIPYRKCIMCKKFKIGSKRYDDIIAGRIYSSSPQIVISQDLNMSTSFLQTHYKGNATLLLPNQIEEIRSKKGKVPFYKIMRDYHIRKERVIDIWRNCERLQQGVDYSNNRSYENNLSNILPIITDNLSNTNTEISKLPVKKISRKKKILQIDEPPSSNIDKTNFDIELSKSGDRSESKTIYHSTSSIPNSDMQTRMEKLREYKNQLQDES